MDSYVGRWTRWGSCLGRLGRDTERTVREGKDPRGDSAGGTPVVNAFIVRTPFVGRSGPFPSSERVSALTSLVGHKHFGTSIPNVLYGSFISVQVRRVFDPDRYLYVSALV